MTDPLASHRRQVHDDADSRVIPCAVLTVSDTRSPDTDVSGARIETLVLEAGHQVSERAIVLDEPDLIRARLDVWIAADDVRAVLITGGTGFGRRDITIDVVRPLFAAEVDGFGELFRVLSHAQIGSAAMLSRAAAGMVTHETGGDTFLFAMPGSPNAVDLAMTKLILPELGHLVWARKG